MSGLALFGIVLVAAIFAPYLAPIDPNKLAMRFKFLPPDIDHPFGTDNFGRSLWSRVIWGARLSVLMGSAVVVLNAVFGTLIGAAAGYFRRLDNGLMRINDALMAFPAILLAIGITAMLGPSTIDAVLALAIVYIPRTARIVRSSVIVLREMEYVQAAGGGRRGTLAHPPAPHHAERDGAADRAALVPVRLHRAGGSDPELPSAWARCRRRRPGATSCPKAGNTCWKRRGSSPSPGWR